MQKLKDRGNHAVPPKKSASAYIIFGKEVLIKWLIILIETSRDPKEKSHGKSNWSRQGNCTDMAKIGEGWPH